MSELVFFIGLIMAFIGFPTAMIDHWSNRPYDTWFPWGFGMGIVGVILCWSVIPERPA